MDTNRIAQYLAGKLPPHYRPACDKLELIELMRMHSIVAYTDDIFKVVNSEEFYSIYLNRLERTDMNALRAIIEKLKIPKNL